MNKEFKRQLKKQSCKVSLCCQRKMEIKQKLLRSMADFPAREHDQEKKEYGFFAKLKTAALSPMPAALLITAMLSGGTAVAADNTVPGDMLYPVKVHVNEGVARVFHMTPGARADFEAQQMARRIQEYQRLEAQGRLTKERENYINDRIDMYKKRANQINKKLDKHPELKARVDSHVQYLLKRYEQVHGEPLNEQTIRQRIKDGTLEERLEVLTPGYPAHIE